MVRIRYKPVLNKAGDRCCPIPTFESSRSGRLFGPRKNDPDAINSPKHMRHTTIVRRPTVWLFANSAR